MNHNWSDNRDDEEEDVPRRGFFPKATAALLGGIVGLAPVAGALGFLLGPLIKPDKGTKSNEDGEGGFLPLAIGPDALPADGTPQSFKISADKVDAWNFFPDQEIGSVWLRKREDGEIIAFNTICPHLGCSVDYRGAQQDFFCPCHFSGFNLDGEKQNSIPPRDMDSLKVKVVDGKIWVEFKNFRAVTDKKIEV